MELGYGYEPKQPRRPSRRLSWLIGLLIFVAIGAAGFILWERTRGPGPLSLVDLLRPRRSATTPVPTLTPLATPTPLVFATPAPEPETDAHVREIVGALSSQPALLTWLATDGLVRSFVTSVLRISEGKAPRRLLLAMAPSGDFQVIERDGKILLDPASYHRYDTATEVVASADPDGVADAFRRLEPRFEAEWRALGQGDKPFSSVLSEAIRIVLKTPEVEHEVELQPKVKSYKMADPGLERRSAAEKQLMRLGPENLRRVKKALRELAARLGLAVAVL